MSYLPYLAVFLLVLTPVLIPAGVTLVHSVRTWRSRPRHTPAVGRVRRQPRLAAQFD